MNDTDYQRQGWHLSEGLLSSVDLSAIDALILSEIREHLPQSQSIQDPEWIELAKNRPEIVTSVYDAIRDHPSILELGHNRSIVDVVKSLIDAPVLYNKIPLRIDVPFENKELAFWHQDDFYVQGNSQELTVWIPLQDTFAHTGALSVMTSSHSSGPIPHTYRVGKKSLPTGIFHQPVNIIEMERGSALFFSSYLIHSSNLNISDQIRYSIQLRYSSSTAGPHSTLMKGTVNV
ncbi:phytanoyl-CoA dioxygenase family protein [Phaeobacter sp.]|uniref:phytanoyl-CoA dioxygenase family protein n=1 Tax=Phaeobacter sp. TaxID=1902409 RepID=UPI0025DBACD6|nr:phytanoyl-CoA dioxygenase family protein [Phaeobacter sp.]